MFDIVVLNSGCEYICTIQCTMYSKHLGHYVKGAQVRDFP
jgi:hypothetical protein